MRKSLCARAQGQDRWVWPSMSHCLLTSAGKWWKLCTHLGWVLHAFRDPQWAVVSLRLGCFLRAEHWDSEVTVENCLTISPSKWVSLLKSMTALNRSSFQFALWSLIHSNWVAFFFQMESNQQHGNGWKSRLAKGWWSRDGEKNNKVHF